MGANAVFIQRLCRKPLGVKRLGTHNTTPIIFRTHNTYKCLVIGSITVLYMSRPLVRLDVVSLHRVQEGGPGISSSDKDRPTHIHG